MSFNHVTHIGVLCKHIRTSRSGRPGLKQIGTMAGYKGGDISREIREFEDGKKVLRKDKFDIYAQALNLEPVGEINLYAMYESFKNYEQEQARLGHCRFDLVLQRQHSQLHNLVTQLQASQTPAIIIDELLYVHAMNSAFLRLYGVNPQKLTDELFWWHSIAIKYHPDSQTPARLAHRGYEGSYHVFEAGRLFNLTCQYLFTQQHKSLIQYLCELSPGWFAQHWEQLLLLYNVPPHPEDVRPMAYQGKPIETQARLQVSAKIEVIPKQHLEFSLVKFEVCGNNAKEIQRDIAKYRRGKPVLFTADYLQDYPHQPY